MNKLLSLIFLGLILHLPLQADDLNTPSDANRVGYVNTLQGTDSNYGFSHGNTLPLVSMPWGMVGWSIENDRGGWFFQPNGKIDGFRATHQPCPWGGDYGQFVLMPQTDHLQMDPGARTSKYDTTTAIFRPDYEKLDLKKGNITAELTGTERCGIFRFTFRQGKVGRLVLDAFSGSEINISGRTIRGISRENSGGVGKNFGYYFVIELDRDITKSDTIVEQKSTDASSAKDGAVSAYVEFKTLPNDPVIVRVGTSYISWEQAGQNIHAEAGGDFDALQQRAQKTWNDNLSRIEIEGTDDQKKTFYSCFFRAQMFPERLYEVNAAGKAVHYSPYDGKLHDGVLYGDIGIWDGFRTTFPLDTLLFPDQMNEILQGFVNASTESGMLQEWPSPGERDGMGGQHSTAIFADALVKGLTGFDVAGAYHSMLKSASPSTGHGERIRSHLDEYLKLGYIPQEVSETLDDTYDDWCIAQIAQIQNHPGDYKTLMARTQNYRNIWDPGIGFMRPKNAEGEWKNVPFDEFAWGNGYTESGPWQSSWFVPHDPAGLASLIGGREKFLAKMDKMMSLPSTFHIGGYGGVIHEMKEMAAVKFGQYEPGNQPAFDNLYLFAVMGQPWKAEYWTRRVCAELYNSSVDGFPGDEDNGSMASWYIFSSMGFYPFCPGSTQYIFTSPVFTKITLHLAHDKTFVITAPSNSGKNVYVQRQQLNGVDVTRTWISHNDIMQGGELHLDMGPDANTRPVRVEDLPYSVSPWPSP